MNDDRNERMKQVKRSLMLIGARFPTVLGVMKSHPSKDGTGPSVGEMWAVGLADLDLDDVDNYCHDVAEYRRPPVPDGETTDKLPFFIRQYCARLAAERERRAEQMDLYHQPGNTSGARALVESGDAKYKQHPYHCTTCHDSGGVQIWHHSVMRDMLGGLPFKRRLTIVACGDCKMGDRRHPDVQVFNPQTMVPCPNALPDDDDVAALANTLRERGFDFDDPQPTLPMPGVES